MKQPRPIVEVHASEITPALRMQLEAEGYCVVVVIGMGHIRTVAQKEKQDD